MNKYLTLPILATNLHADDNPYLLTQAEVERFYQTVKVVADADSPGAQTLQKLLDGLRLIAQRRIGAVELKEHPTNLIGNRRMGRAGSFWRNASILRVESGLRQYFWRWY